MPPKPEMAELEYVFGENGGRGTPVPSFFKRKSKKVVESDAAPKVIGAGFSHISTAPQATRSNPTLSKKPDYFDLDDDWDATVEPAKEVPLTRKETLKEVEALNSTISRILRFEKVLNEPIVNIDQLRKLAYSGIPHDLRPRTWQLLLGYAPPNAARCEATLAKRRKEYFEAVEQVQQSRDPQMWHQIAIDVKRTNPHLKLYQSPIVRASLERILYLWSIRHPACGYVQGINDLATPFYQVFLEQHVDSPIDIDPTKVPQHILQAVEADTFWCLTKLLESIQDNYIHAQPGIHKQVAQLESLCQRIDGALHTHFVAEHIEFMQFSFRWMNCLLMREVPMDCTIRIWDSYLAEGSQGFSEFHVYVCAAFLAQWAPQLKTMDFQDMLIFLQRLPTEDWGEAQVELVLSQAFMWQTLFGNTKHLAGTQDDCIISALDLEYACEELQDPFGKEPDLVRDYYPPMNSPKILRKITYVCKILKLGWFLPLERLDLRVRTSKRVLRVYYDNQHWVESFPPDSCVFLSCVSALDPLDIDRDYSYIKNILKQNPEKLHANCPDDENETRGQA